MFRRFVIAFIVTMAAILESAADAIAATLPPPDTDRPRLRVVASGMLCVRGAPGRRGGPRPGPPRGRRWPAAMTRNQPGPASTQKPDENRARAAGRQIPAHCRRQFRL